MSFEQVYGRLTDKLSDWLDNSIEMVPNLAVALLVVLAFWVLSKVAAAFVERALKRLHTRRSVRSLVVALARFGVLAAGIVVALSVLNLDKALASILAGAGVVGLALGFAFQDLASNFISGVGLSVNRPFKIGDVIETDGVFGVVKDLQLRMAIVETLDGKTVILPNKLVFQNKLINFSTKGKLRVDVECGVSYGDDLDKVCTVAKKAIGGLEQCDASSPVEVFFHTFGDSSIGFVARFWTSYESHKDFLEAQHAAIIGIKRAFDENEISIPWPIRTLDFGIKGGVSLSDIAKQASSEESARGSQHKVVEPPAAVP